MDGGQRRTETGCRVEPAAVRLAGGERSAQHRFPRGAAGIDKGSAAASLVPFTAPMSKTFRRTPGERNHSTKCHMPDPLPDGGFALSGLRSLPPGQPAAPIAGWRYAYPAYSVSSATVKPSGRCGDNVVHHRILPCKPRVPGQPGVNFPRRH